MSTAKPRKRAKPAPAVAVPRRPPRPVEPLPEWYAPAASATVRDDRYALRHSTRLNYQMAEDMRRGDLVMPTWQRAPAWSMEQRIAYIDSMIRGIPSGSMLVWQPPYGAETEHRPFPGIIASDRPVYVVDGQQRLTTILMAARGEIPVFWDGIRWGNRGVVSIEYAMRSNPPFELYRSIQATEDERSLDTMVWACERVCRYEHHLVLLDGHTEAEARAAYVRMASCGTSHGPRVLSEALADSAIGTGAR